MARLPLAFSSLILGWMLSVALNPLVAKTTLCRQFALGPEACTEATVPSLVAIIFLTAVTSYCLTWPVSRLPALQAFKIRAVLQDGAFQGIVVSFDVVGTVLYRLWVGNEEFGLFHYLYFLLFALAALYALAFDVFGEWLYRRYGIRPPW